MNKIRCSLRAETSERPTCTDSPIDFKVRGPEQERRARDDQEEEEEEEAEDRSLPVKGDTSEGHHRAAGPPLAGQGHLQGQHMQRSATTSTSSSSSSSNHPFVCLACDKGFKYDHSLNFHIKSYHGNDTNNSNGHADTLLTMKGMNKKLSRSRKLASSSLLSPSNGTRIVADELMVTEDHGSDDEHQQHHLEDALNNNNNNNNHDKRLSSLSSSSSSRGGRGGGGGGAPGDTGMGFPPNIPVQEIQIKSEKGLVTILEGIHPQSEQPYSLYQCCLCGFAFPSLEPIFTHIQSMHSSNTKSALTCDKCGAMFKWKSELQIHEHLHTAMEQKAAKLSASNGTTAASKQQSASKTPAAMASSQLAMPMPSVLPSSLALLFSYFAETNGTNCPEATTSASDSVDNSNSNDHAIGLDLTNYKIKTETESRQFEQEVPLIVPKKKIKQEAKSPNSLDSSDDALSLFKENPYQPPKVSSALGEIKETAPGQFKCRFCDKTFDRIFSVHRHERVHTGYKPCVCDVCGRRFSEKRNLRHHIIRFHSDGSGRELLKRARKDKTLAATAKQLASTVLKNAVLEC